jgi:hypothetical protein
MSNEKLEKLAGPIVLLAVVAYIIYDLHRNHFLGLTKF